MASAFGWSPGGCCCDVAQGPFAIGVDSITNPTRTRIPKRAVITFSGITAPASTPGNPTCGNPEWLQSRNPHLVAYAPSYSYYRSLSEYVNDARRLQMCWTSPKAEHVIEPVWPGYAGGTPTFDNGIIPTRGPYRPVNMIRNFHNNVTPFPYGYTLSVPQPMIYSPALGACRFTDSEQNNTEVYELSLVCGAEATETSNAPKNCTILFSTNAHQTAGITGDGIPIWKREDASIPWAYYDFPIENTAPRQQRICVIPDSITLSRADTIKLPNGVIPANTRGFLGNFDDATISIEFMDWFEGPLATLP